MKLVQLLVHFSKRKPPEPVFLQVPHLNSTGLVYESRTAVCVLASRFPAHLSPPFLGSVWGSNRCLCACQCVPPPVPSMCTPTSCLQFDLAAPYPEGGGFQCRSPPGTCPFGGMGPTWCPTLDPLVIFVPTPVARCHGEILVPKLKKNESPWLTNQSPLESLE